MLLKYWTKSLLEWDFFFHGFNDNCVRNIIRYLSIDIFTVTDYPVVVLTNFANERQQNEAHDFLPLR